MGWKFRSIVAGVALVGFAAAAAAQTTLPARVPMWSTTIGDILVGNSTLQSAVRQFALTDGKADSGIPLTAAAGTPAGAMGISRTAGTSLRLSGEATGVGNKTDKVLWEFALPPTYVAGAAIPITVNANVAGGGTITAASTTLTLAAYTEAATGAEAAITGITAAQQFTATAANYTFTIPGTGIVPNQRIIVEFTVLVTCSAGTCTGQINNVSGVM